MAVNASCGTANKRLPAGIIAAVRHYMSRGLLLGALGTWVFTAAAQEPPQLSVADIIARLSSNEVAVAAVSMKGRYVVRHFDVDGNRLSQIQSNEFQFYRSNEFVRLDMQGTQFTIDSSTDKPALIPIRQAEFWSPDATVHVDLRVANRAEASKPRPFPLGFGFGLLYVMADDPGNTSGKPEIRTASSILQNSSRNNLLTVRPDPDHPSITMLELGGHGARAEWGVDVSRGCMIVRTRVYVMGLNTPDKEDILEETEAEPKNTNGVWYISRVRRDYGKTLQTDRVVQRVVSLREQESLEITSFDVGGKFSPCDVQFCEKSFPELRFLIDSLKHESINFETGKRSAWPPPGQ